MKTKKIILAALAGAVMLLSAPKAEAQVKYFTTIGGHTDTSAIGVHAINYYCTNFNPVAEATVQIAITASSHADDTIYGVGAVWGSNDGTNYIQLSQLDTYNANFSDSLTVATGTHGVSLVKTKFWTYNIRRTSQPIPRFWKVVWTNKTTGNADTVDVRATLQVNQ